MFADTSFVACPSGFSWTRLEAVLTRLSGTGVTQPNDTCIWGISLAILDVGVDKCVAVDQTTAALVEPLLTTLWTALKAHVSPDFTLREWRWYAYNDQSTKPGPAYRVTPVGVVGTGAGSRMPDQVSSTITYRTASRKHWGRSYLAGLISADLGLLGMENATAIDANVNAFHTFANGAFALATPVTLGVGSVRQFGFLTMSALEGDNVYDVQRRRRANQSTYQKIYTS